MKVIKYRKFEVTESNECDFSMRKLIANDLCRQILEKYNYKPKLAPKIITTLLPEVNALDDGIADYGVEDIIKFKDMPEYDLLNLKQIEHGQWHYSNYTFDYKSNNMSDNESIYIKLMEYHPPKYYSSSDYPNNDTSIDYLDKIFAEDIKKWTNTHGIRPITINSSIMKYYGNNQILSNCYKTDFIFYVNYTQPEDNLNSQLDTAYLVSTNKLRIQIVDILNEILRKGNSKSFIGKKQDFKLNHNIMNAYLIFKDTLNDELNGIKLFRSLESDIILKIPYHLLYDYLRFNAKGEIIN